MAWHRRQEIIGYKAAGFGQVVATPLAHPCRGRGPRACWHRGGQTVADSRLKQPPRRPNRVDGPSPPGTLFVIGRDGTRDQVIRMYEIHLRHSPDLIAALPELAGKRLGCFCKPLPCYGDVLLKLLAEFFPDL